MARELITRSATFQPRQQLVRSSMGVFSSPSTKPTAALRPPTLPYCAVLSATRPSVGEARIAPHPRRPRSARAVVAVGGYDDLEAQAARVSQTVESSVRRMRVARQAGTIEPRSTPGTAMHDRSAARATGGGPRSAPRPRGAARGRAAATGPPVESAWRRPVAGVAPAAAMAAGDGWGRTGTGRAVPSTSAAPAAGRAPRDRVEVPGGGQPSRSRGP
jgi:hypothetical protein